MADIVGGGTPSTQIDEYWDGNIDWYAPAEMLGQIYANGSVRKITQLGLQKSSAKILPANKTVLFTSRAGIGKMAILKQNAATNQGFQSLVLKDKINPYFIYSMGNDIKQKAESIASGSTFLEISGKMLGNIDVYCPTHQEQQVIGTLFEKLDNLITLHQRKYLNLQTLKNSILTSIFSQKLCFYKEITWEQRKLGEIGNTYTGLSGKTKEDFGHGNAQFVTYMNVFSNPISNPKSIEYVEIDNRQNKVLYGDIFFTTSSETPEEVGMSSIWLENKENTYLNSFCFGYRLNDNTNINLHYLAYMLRAPQFRSNMVLLAQGISRYNISKNKAMEISIDIPKHKSEQEKIGTILYQLDNLITLHQRKAKILENIKISLLIKGFNIKKE